MTKKITTKGGIHYKLKKRAKLNKTSILKFVAAAQKSLSAKSWPEGYEDLFGSITDESFFKQKVPDWSLDIPRES